MKSPATRTTTAVPFLRRAGPRRGPARTRCGRPKRGSTLRRWSSRLSAPPPWSRAPRVKRLPTLRLYSLALAVLCCAAGRAQPFTRLLAEVPVTVDGSVLPQPFSGGLNAPQHEFADLDGDGDLDLVVFDVDGAVDFYRNEGAGVFRIRRDVVTMPPFLFWFLFVDLDGDGLIDCCTDDSSSGVRFWRNAGTAANPAFVADADRMLDTAGQPVFAGFASIPSFADINGDGLHDVLSSNTADGSINYYRNVGTAASPAFAFVTSAFQGITVIGDTCFSPPRGGVPGPAMHGTGVLRFAD